MDHAESATTAWMRGSRAAVITVVVPFLVLGASREEASKSALILVVLAEEAPRADADKGTAGPKAAEKKK